MRYFAIFLWPRGFQGEDIWKFKHFANIDTIVPSGQPGYNRLAKVCPVIDRVRQSFLHNYHPHRQNADDEASRADQQ